MSIKIALTSDTHYGHSRNTHQIHEKFLDQLSKENFDILIHAGDWTSYKQEQFKRTLTMFRKYFPDKDILGVRGNHDFWNRSKISRGSLEERFQDVYGRKYRIGSWPQMLAKHQQWFNENEIVLLENGPFIKDDVIFLGYDGWYHNVSPPTNDKEFMPEIIQGAPMHSFLNHKAHKELDALLNIDVDQYRASVCITHMPMFCKEPEYYEMYCANLKYMDPITEKFDVLCVGHSHRYENFEHNGCRVYNCGSGYDKPKYIIFDL